jgi:hypothetical protein
MRFCLFDVGTVIITLWIVRVEYRCHDCSIPYSVFASLRQLCLPSASNPSNVHLQFYSKQSSYASSPGAWDDTPSTLEPSVTLLFFGC